MLKRKKPGCNWDDVFASFITRRLPKYLEVGGGDHIRKLIAAYSVYDNDDRDDYASVARSGRDAGFSMVGDRGLTVCEMVVVRDVLVTKLIES